MLTDFGLEVRKLRLEKRMRLKEMAEKLKMSSAFLSAVETGRKRVPPGLPERIAELMDLDDLSAARLRKAAAKSVRSIRLDVSQRDERAQELAVTFARKFPSMDTNEVQRLMKALVDSKPARHMRREKVKK
jgi:transcriptional regulator with XRE-family HTH domain